MTFARFACGLTFGIFTLAWLTAGASAAGLGGWADGPSYPERLACTVKKNATPTTGILVTAVAGSEVELRVFNTDWSMGEGRLVELSVSLDNLHVTDDWPYQASPDGVRVSWPGLGAGLTEASRISVQGSGTGFELSLKGAEQAINDVQACASRLEADRGSSEEAEMYDDDADGGDLGGGANGLGDAMADNSIPIIAAYLCDVSATALTGMPDMTGANKTTSMTFAVDQDGQLHVNGASIPPEQVEPHPDNQSQIGTVAYRADAVAASGSTLPSNMPGISQESMQGLAAAQSFMLGQAFAGRDRYMMISIANDMVAFFDLSPTGQTVNASAPNCVRTQ